MDQCQKCELLTKLAAPFGYCYHCQCGFFSSTLDAWQKDFGYTHLYDRLASKSQMVFDCEPIYFDYAGKTWLIEFWKGQYGINTGAEIGIYHADKIISPSDYKTTLFHCADKEEMLPCSLHLFGNNGVSAWVSEKHWWLTAFLTGYFSNPAELCVEATLTFPNQEMLSAFAKAMYTAGYNQNDFHIYGLWIVFTFYAPKHPETSPSILFWRRYSQWKNKHFCRIYLWITKPFCTTEDRILYLYYYLPIAFRKTLRLHRFQKKQKKL